MRWALSLLVTTVVAVPSVATAGLRCGKSIVSTNSSTLEVRAKCGTPDRIDSKVEARTVRQFLRNVGYVEHRVVVELERWTYVLAPNKLIRTAEFENGRLTRVRTEGRPPKSPASIPNCRRAVISTGDLTTEVQLRCGPPDDVQRWTEEIAQGNLLAEQRVMVNFERWTYNFGPNQFLRILHFKDGRLVDQKTGPRGW